MKDKKSMAMIIIVGIIISLFLFVSTTTFATTGTVVTSDLRLRKEESTNSEILDLLDENDKVEIISENGDWYKVKANGKIGYVSKEYIKVKDDEKVENTTNSTTDSENKNEVETKTEEKAEEKPEESKEENKEEVKEENTEKTPEDNAKTEQKQEIPNKCKFESEVQLKVMPVINGIVIASTNSEEEYDVVSTAGMWSYVKSGSKSGWVLTNKIVLVSTDKTEEDKNDENSEEKSEENKDEKKEEKKEEQKVEEPADSMYSNPKTYYVKGTAVNARSKASKDSEVVKVLNTNNSVKVTGENGTWYVVDLNGKKAYIAKSLLSSEKVEVTSRNSNSLSENNNQQAAQQVPAQPEPAAPVASNPSGGAIVEYAKTFLGYSYVYGTAGPNTFDCSGFVQYVYKHFGYSLSRSSGTQANDGVAVSKSDLQAGDVLIFRDTSNTRIGHVGIYIGDGQFIHASNSRTGVIISSLYTDAYQRRYVGARRIL